MQLKKVKHLYNAPRYILLIYRADVYILYHITGTVFVNNIADFENGTISYDIANCI